MFKLTEAKVKSFKNVVETFMLLNGLIVLICLILIIVLDNESSVIIYLTLLLTVIVYPFLALARFCLSNIRKDILSEIE